jgi:hypothetical protein
MKWEVKIHSAFRSFINAIISNIIICHYWRSDHIFGELHPGSAQIEKRKYQFKRDKIISVGEDFYRFSAYALLRLNTLLDNYETLLNYSTQEARNILQQTDINVQVLLTKIGENNVTITTADIFYGVSGIEDANSFSQTFKTAQAIIEERFASGADMAEIIEALDVAKTILRKYIKIIERDRLTISNRIKEILEINLKQVT